MAGQEAGDEGDQPNVKRTKIDYTTTITVLVGEDATAFAVHKDANCSKSKFFAAACSSRCTEGKERVVRLPELKPDTFQKYVHWVYSNEVDP